MTAMTTPGVYACTTTRLTTLTDLSFDAAGDVNAVWVLQFAGTASFPAPPTTSFTLLNGAQPDNIYICKAAVP